MRIIAHIRNDLREKFGTPRQSGLAEHLKGRIVFTPEFRIPEALRGLEGFSHIWLIWLFSQNEGWSPTVRPPRLGGNERVGVFACRSPFRPNPLGLSCVRLERVELTAKDGPVLHVRGADLIDGTPILDIKPYLPSSDSIPDASAGFTAGLADALLRVEFSPSAAAMLSQDHQETLREILRLDPRPRYHSDPERIYGMKFGNFNVRFRIAGGAAYVIDIATT